MVSLLKALFGDAATADNEFGYPWLPKLDAGKAYSWLDLFDAMYKGSIKGFFAWGMNPACSGANANKTRAGHGEPGLAGERQPLRQRDRLLLEAAPAWTPPRSRPRSSCCRPCVSVEKEGSDQQQRPLDAVALSGAEAPGRKPARTATSSWRWSTSSRSSTRKRAGPSPSPFST